MKQLILLIFSILSLQISFAQGLFIDNTWDAETLITDFFEGRCVSISNISSTGNPSGMAFFEASETNLGINAGIALCSGDASIAIGPNDQTGAGMNHLSAGDSDLDELLSTPDITNDATILEFDLVPDPEVTFLDFRYVFGSEEYQEYVGSAFNDVFAFFVSGPGMDGLQNIALIPSTDIPVAINNVNHETNSEYYVDNPEDDETTIQYDGFTTEFSAGFNVIPGEVYQIKLAIADVADGILDSGVFISVESLCGDESLMPIVDFEPEIEGNQVSFQNLARYGTAWEWDFGDGTSSEERYPVHSYAEEGTYEVQLRVENWCCTETITETVIVGETTGGIDLEEGESPYRYSYNSATKSLEIDTRMEDATIQFYNESGQLVSSHRLNGFGTISLAGLGKGLYIMQVVFREGVFTERILVY